MMVEAPAGEAVPREHPPPPELEARELPLLEVPLDPPLLEELEATDELLPASAEELPPPPDAMLELLLPPEA